MAPQGIYETSSMYFVGATDALATPHYTLAWIVHFLLGQGTGPGQAVIPLARDLGHSDTYHLYRQGAGLVKKVKVQVCCFLIVVLGLVSLARAQRPKMPAPAPVPRQIGAAQKVFIANGGGESFETIINQTVFDGGPDRPYNQFYAAMKEWGRYELVASPADADLVVEVSWDLTDVGLQLPVLGELRLVILDPKTHVTLWTVIEHVRGAILLGNRDKNFDQAMNTVMKRMKDLVAPPTTPANLPGN